MNNRKSPNIPEAITLLFSVVVSAAVSSGTVWLLFGTVQATFKLNDQAAVAGGAAFFLIVFLLAARFLKSLLHPRHPVSDRSRKTTGTTEVPPDK